MRYGCQQCREEASGRPADELTHLERARLAAHLEACPACRSHAARYAAAIDAARGWDPPLAAADREVILDRVIARTEPARPPPSTWRRAAAFWLPAAAALAVLALGRPWTEDSRGPPPRGEAAGDRLGTPLPPAPGEARGPASADAIAPAPVRPSAALEPRHLRRATTHPARGTPGPPGPASPLNLPPPPAADLPGPSRAQALYADAEVAMAEGRAAGAARILEELVEAVPDSVEAQAARLELGRLYAGPLAYPARAVAHLSAFVAREQEPVARGAARGVLCRLLPAAERDRICWPGLAARPQDP